MHLREEGEIFYTSRILHVVKKNSEVLAMVVIDEETWVSYFEPLLKEE